MAVYTELSETEIRKYCTAFRLGRLESARPVAGGTINTIYALRTSQGRFVLRLLESRSLAEVRYELELVSFLSGCGLKIARALSGPSGPWIQHGRDQFVSVSEFLGGSELQPDRIEDTHCHQIGRFAAGLHVATNRFRRRRKNPFATPKLLAKLRLGLPRTLDPEVRADLAVIEGTIVDAPLEEDLPQGTVHGDLFVDNARFARGKLVGVFDFEMAHYGPYIYDLAVLLLDWCLPGERFKRSRVDALLRGYESIRCLTAEERQGLARMCGFVAARYALTRWFDFEVNADRGAIRTHKDYRVFMGRLEAVRTLRVPMSPSSDRLHA